MILSIYLKFLEFLFCMTFIIPFVKAANEPGHTCVKGVSPRISPFNGPADLLNNTESKYGKFVYITGAGKRGFTDCLLTLKKNIYITASLFKDYRIIVYYQHYDKADIDQWLQEDPKLIPIQEDFAASKKICPVHENSNTHCRTLLLAYIRNILYRNVIASMKSLKQSFETTYMVSMDLDAQYHAIELNLFDRNLLVDVMKNSKKWDQVSFNNAPEYYDIWALRYSRFNLNLWAMGEDAFAQLGIIRRDIKYVLANYPNDYYPVYSAWNGVAIYKMNYTLGCTYDGACDPRDKYPNCFQGEVEIWSFHRCMGEKHKARLMINKNCLINFPV